MPLPEKARRNNRKVGLMALSLAVAMLGLGYASVPLYRIFCQVTGFGGTPQIASEAKAAAVNVTGETISVRFDSNIAPDMPWQFKPEQVTETAQLGERKIAFYIARNNSDKPVTGQASYNVEPEQAAPYFNKIQCFCFTKQTLQPGEEVRMPVTYYVDPAILKDENAKGVEQITLSYTFHNLHESGS
ncbi:cytochrome c oxidase assembly protein [Altererythrobacter sp. CC-YST694]|uniref:cytochrome c oxidase assembly protein n=1 Tax=Altererythrobacter sp. CC-YST694 TaxID=2755038 RepID=UPI001D026AA5|nr:cytochrome c oxidase assembly protein [Altererythrobacter sp. CC-YST694]MCB5424002.1 cytochrome c oxidase assembly protein [Altererythrobacter sp. CC-YST694]